jgi:hypothetical protein
MMSFGIVQQRSHGTALAEVRISAPFVLAFFSHGHVSFSADVDSPRRDVEASQSTTINFTPGLTLKLPVLSQNRTYAFALSTPLTSILL